jgi:hypothetical protein
MVTPTARKLQNEKTVTIPQLKLAVILFQMIFLVLATLGISG